MHTRARRLAVVEVAAATRQIVRLREQKRNLPHICLSPGGFPSTLITWKHCRAQRRRHSWGVGGYDTGRWRGGRGRCTDRTAWRIGGSGGRAIGHVHEELQFASAAGWVATEKPEQLQSVRSCLVWSQTAGAAVREVMRRDTRL